MYGSAQHSRRKSTIRVDGTLDIECAAWDRFVVGVTYHRFHGSCTHESLESLVDRVLLLGGTWWSHNGGSYDNLAIGEELRRRGISASIALSGSRVSRIVGGGFVLCDSFGLVPMKLEIAASIAGHVSPELGWSCSCGRACGGYCRITTKLPSARLRDLAAYCEADARVLLDVLDAIVAHATQSGYALRGTIGGTAWATARDALDIPDAEFPAAVWRRIRQGYKGGRVSVFRPRADGPGHHYDLSSAYPAALASTSLPVGQFTEYGAREALLCLGNSRPGIYACTVSVPQCHVPPLAWAHKGGTAYPIGPVSGAWTLPELEQAIERGAEILDVDWAIVWSDEAVLFDELIAEWFRVRMLVGKKTALGEWQRLLCNSLTGKLAEQPNRRFVRMHPDPTKIKICLGERPCTRLKCTGACDAFEQLDMWGELWSVPYYRQAASGHLHWAAYLTASTRNAWLVGAESQGTDIVYGDTDSIWTTSRLGPKPAGEALGQWSYKFGWTDFECAAPKAYSFVDDKGVRTMRVAGAQQITDKEWSAGRAEQDRGVLSFLEAARQSRGLFHRKHRTWSLPVGGRNTGWYGDRLLDPDERLTLPTTCVALRKKASAR